MTIIIILRSQLLTIIPVSQGTIKNDLREAGVSLRAYGAELLPVDKQAVVTISSFMKTALLDQFIKQGC